MTPYITGSWITFTNQIATIYNIAKCLQWYGFYFTRPIIGTSINANWIVADVLNEKHVNHSGQMLFIWVKNKWPMGNWKNIRGMTNDSWCFHSYMSFSLTGIFFREMEIGSIYAQTCVIKIYIVSCNIQKKITNTFYIVLLEITYTETQCTHHQTYLTTLFFLSIYFYLYKCCHFRKEYYFVPNPFHLFEFEILPQKSAKLTKVTQ